MHVPPKFSQPAKDTQFIFAAPEEARKIDSCQEGMLKIGWSTVPCTRGADLWRKGARGRERETGAARGREENGPALPGQSVGVARSRKAATNLLPCHPWRLHSSHGLYVQSAWQEGADFGESCTLKGAAGTRRCFS